jgi:hypothetical protein
MNRDEVIFRLKAAEMVLRRQGVAGAAVFGSLARGEEGPGSDIDIAIKPAIGRAIGPDGLLALYGFFSDLFGPRSAVDVVILPARDRELGEAIEREAVFAFS